MGHDWGLSIDRLAVALLRCASINAKGATTTVKRLQDEKFSAPPRSKIWVRSEPRNKKVLDFYKLTTFDSNCRNILLSSLLSDFIPLDLLKGNSNSCLIKENIKK